MQRFSHWTPGDSNPGPVCCKATVSLIELISDHVMPTTSSADPR